MANVLGTLFGDIAKEIRAKTGETGTMKPAEFPEKISEISVGSDPVVQALEVTENGTYTPDEGIDGYSPVTVNVPTILQDKTVTENGTYEADSDFDGLGKVTVNVPAPEIVLQDKRITQNGTYTADGGYDGLGQIQVNVPDIPAVVQPLDVTENGAYAPPSGVDGFSSVNVNVPAPEIVLQNKTITENGTYTADEGFDGLGEVTVEVAGAGSVEEPMIKYISQSSTASGNPDSEHTLSFSLSKNTKVLAAYVSASQSTSYYPNLTRMEKKPISELTVNTTNATYNKWTVPIKFASNGFTGTFKKSFMARLLVTVPGITVTSRGDGFYDGKLNYIDSYEKPIADYDFFVVQPAMMVKNFVIADGIDKIPSRLLENQDYLENVDMPNVTTIMNSAFGKCAMLKNVDLSNVTSIGSGAFANCESLTSINLNPNISDIGSQAFNGCTSLTGELVIPASITKLKAECFSGTKFDRVVFHGGITAFGGDGSGAFQNCTHPTEFDFSAFTSVPTLGYGPWLGVVGSGQVLKIPSALFDTWSTKQYWSDWASQMVAV